MSELFKCEYCGKFISHESIDAHFDGENTIINSRMHYTGYPEPEPWGNLYWHVECESKRKPKHEEQL